MEKNKSEMMQILVFWVVSPCGLVGRFQHFGETYCLHLDGAQLLTSSYSQTQLEFQLNDFDLELR
jgi:hypothetical protein